MDHLKPSQKEERHLRSLGFELIAGMDEVGRGALAGPVAAAAGIMPRHPRGDWVSEVRDSKQLTPAARETLFPRIKQSAVSVGFGLISHEVIDYIGIVAATRLAMKMAVARLEPAPA